MALLHLLLKMVDAAEPVGDEASLLLRLGAESDAALLAPPGCHVMVGTTRAEGRCGVFGRHWYSWAVTGTLREGTWDHLKIKTTSGPDSCGKTGLYCIPAFGSVPGGRGVGAFRYLLDALPGAVSTRYARADGERIVLVSTLDGGPHSENRIETTFEGTPSRPRTWSVRVSSPVRGLDDGGHPVRVLRADIELRAGPDGAPHSESMDARFGQGVATCRVTIRTDWQHAPCAAPLQP